MAPMYFAKILVLYPKRLNTSNVYFYKSVKTIFSAPNHFCTSLERCSNFELEADLIFYVTVSQCKWVSGVDTYEAEIAADSIIWELFAKKSAECLNLRNSFITISRLSRNWQFALHKLEESSSKEWIT